MKIQVMFVVLAALALCVNGAAVKSQSDTESAPAPELVEIEATSAETFNLIDGFITPQDRLLYRGHFSRPAAQGVVQSQDVTYRAPSGTNIRISYITAMPVGGTTTAFAQVVRGGLYENNVTIRLSSLSGSGFQFWVEVWGR